MNIATDNTMTYEGYTIEVEYDAEGKMLVGRVSGLRHAMIDCMGESIAEFEQDFHNAINHYLELCEEDGKIPEKAV